jgi:ABC-type Mn2+/Zn2+ transport system ATPase subunit
MNIIIKKVNSRGIDHENNTPTLELNGVSVAYGAGITGAYSTQGPKSVSQNYALEDVTFRLSSGQQLAIVGPNGAGKSTLLKVIVGTLKPTLGKVNVFGHEPDCHICIAYVPQRNQIDWSFPVSVKDVVMMGRIGRIGLFRWPRNRDWEIVQTSLTRVNLGHLAQKQIGELSGGQQQRVFIARALAQRADLLLLDEPFTGLDVPSHEAILEILSSLRDDGVTVLVATHDLNLAAERFDQVMLLNKRIIGLGRGELVLSQENLLQAYSGHLHRIGGEENDLMFTDTCCDHGQDENG